MKKIVIGLFLLVLALQVVNAEIVIDSFETEKYNLGDVVTLNGYVQDVDSIMGTLEINSVCENESKPVYFSTFLLEPEEKYDIAQEFPVKESMVGMCYFKINLKSDEGNILDEESSGDFSVTNDLRVEVETNVLTQKPGEDVIVKGIIRKANGIRVGSGSVVLTLNNKIYASSLSNGAFSYTINLPEDIGSGIQIIDIRARDLEGNDGIDKVEFKVISMPEGLSIELDKDMYRPGDRIIAKVLLNDQSGKNILGSSTVQLYDSNGDEDLTRVVDNGNDFEIFLSEVSLPGTWILEAKNNDFEIDKKFYVETVKDKNIELKGNELIITNVGNVEFDDPIQIDLKNENGEEYRVIKKTSLKPNQTIIMDLGGEVPGGNYDVGVGGSMITGNVVVEGGSFKNLRNSINLGYFALIFVGVFFIFVVVSKGRKRLSRREMAREKGKKLLEENSSKEVIDKIVEQKREEELKKKDKDFLINKAKDSLETVPLPPRPSQENSEKEVKKNPLFDIFN